MPQPPPGPPQPAAAAYPVQGSYPPQQQYPYQGAPVYYDPYGQQQAFQTFDMGAPGAVQCMSLWGEIQFEDSEGEIEEEIGETTEKERPSPKSVKSGDLGILAILKWALYALLFILLVPGVGAVTPRPTVHPNRLYPDPTLSYEDRPKPILTENQNYKPPNMRPSTLGRIPSPPQCPCASGIRSSSGSGWLGSSPGWGGPRPFYSPHWCSNVGAERSKASIF
jgi:hypothetical protein